jgi:glyoxylase-like metal-dependent hydrolase (beta-lactamase superfamily II)
VRSDVRCFLVPHASGVVLVDAGLPGSVEAITSTLTGLSAGWTDVSDVVVTHAHFDHVGGLAEVVAKAASATLRASAAETSAVAAAAGGREVAPLEPGAAIGGLTALLAPGHTPGHLCLLAADDGLLLAGDVVGCLQGVLVRPPGMFTDDPALAEQSLRHLAGLDVTRLITSHGPELVDGPAQLASLASA